MPQIRDGEGRGRQDSSPFQLFCSRAGSDAEARTSSLEEAVELDAALEGSSPRREPGRFARELGPADPLLYIYTSGTTGLPKAVVVKHSRQAFACLAAVRTLSVGRGDRMYTYLPLYHASGGQLGTAFALLNGTTTVIRRKFSASNFWKDCVKFDVTVRRSSKRKKKFLAIMY